MKAIVIAALLLITGYFAYQHFHSPSKPTVGEVEPALQDYLVAGKGDCRVTHLTDLRIGDYAEVYGGWPVYASHEEVCREGNTTTTYNGLDDAGKQAALAFARRTATGGIEIFLPTIFKDALQQMSQDVNQQLQQSTDTIKSN